MLLAYITTSQGHFPELCLVADKASTFSMPVRIATMLPTENAIHLLSVEEGVTMAIDPTDNSRIITPIVPANLYLTPNRPEKPGYKVDRVKIIEGENGNFIVFLDRGDRGWESWQPNQKLY